MKINKIFGLFLEKFLILQHHTKVWRYWGNKVRGIIPNYLYKKECIIIGSKFDFILTGKNKKGVIYIRKGINTLWLKKQKIRGGWHMITAKIF
jgi:hypothetical protein